MPGNARPSGARSMPHGPTPSQTWSAAAGRNPNRRIFAAAHNPPDALRIQFHITKRVWEPELDETVIELAPIPFFLHLKEEA
jgi:hypothetical protein